MTGRSLRTRLEHHLERLYPGRTVAERNEVAERIIDVAGLDPADVPGDAVLPTEDEVVLITYGDTFLPAAGPEVAGLGAMLRGPLAGIFSTVHVLPFFTASSDGGFAIVDYREVSPSLGGWEDVAAAIGENGFMVDLVCNHGSAQSSWFRRFLADEAPYRDWYLTADPASDDVAGVVRPRTHPLLHPFETAAGTRHVWATFSEDQVDFDFTNPEVLIEFCSIVAFYLDRGATRIRLDAIAYLWKRLGTSCIHLSETHEVVKLFRTLVAARDPAVLLITETNVPHDQNVSYFADGDEAHVVYNFTLAPLLAWSVLAERADVLTRWLGRFEDPPDGCVFLNFIASHDGIGLRPVEDLIPRGEIDRLLDAAAQVGGSWSLYSAPGGPRPYELNVSLADLLAGPDGRNVDRFVAAHALMLALAGIPAFYVHSMLASPGDVDAVLRTGHKRDINRQRVSVAQATIDLRDGWRAEACARLGDLIRIRRGQSAFDPSAAQIVHVLGDGVVAVERSSIDQRILAITNVTSQRVQVSLPAWVGTVDLITGAPGQIDHDGRERTITLAPYRSSWLSDGVAAE